MLRKAQVELQSIRCACNANMSTIEPDSGASAAEALDFFKTMKSILHTLGLYDFRDSFALLDYIKYAIAVCFWFATFLTSFHFVVLNSSDLQKTSTALFAANIMLISTIYFTMLFGQKSALRELLDRIEDVARTRECAMSFNFRLMPV